MASLLLTESIAGLANTNWKERLAAMEKFIEVSVIKTLTFPVQRVYFIVHHCKGLAPVFLNPAI